MEGEGEVMEEEGEEGKGVEGEGEVVEEGVGEGGKGRHKSHLLIGGCRIRWVGGEGGRRREGKRVNQRRIGGFKFVGF